MQQPFSTTAATGTASTSIKTRLNGGRFDFDDGGTYCGGWEDGKAHGHGVCTGPKGQGAYSGSWHFGFEVSGVYTWPSGSSYEGQWQNGKRHGLGVECRGRWIYRGEWTQGFKGRYGVRQSNTSNAKYEGTWANGLQDGYGSETYADAGTYQGQWLRGMRHGYGVRASAPFGLASHFRPKQPALRTSLTSLRSDEGVAPNDHSPSSKRRRAEESRGGFVLKAKSDRPPPPQRRGSLSEKQNIAKTFFGFKKGRSTGDLGKRIGSANSFKSSESTASWMSNESSHSGVGPHNGESVQSDSNASFLVEDEHLDPSVTESYLGEWKNDKRSGYGVSERSDGLRYEGEWFNNKKYGYGVTTMRDGTREEGKYKNNVLITSAKRRHVFLLRSAKFRERIDAAVNAAQRASKIALQKADIAISRMATARDKAHVADECSTQARTDFSIALLTAKQFAPDFTLPSLEKIQLREGPISKSILEKINANDVINNNLQISQPPLPPRGGATPPTPSYPNRTSSFQTETADLDGLRPNAFRNPSTRLSDTSSIRDSPQDIYAAPQEKYGSQISNHYSSALHPQHNNQELYKTPQTSFNAQQQVYQQNNAQQRSYQQNNIHQSNSQHHYQPNNVQQQSIQNNNSQQRSYQQNNTQQQSYQQNTPQQQLYQPNDVQQQAYQKNNSSQQSYQQNNPQQQPYQQNNAQQQINAQQQFYHQNNPQQRSYQQDSIQQQFYQQQPNPSPPYQPNNPSNQQNSVVQQQSHRSQQQNFSTPRHSQQFYSQNKSFDTDSQKGDQSDSSATRRTPLRRNSKLVSGESPYNFKQAMSDHYDHYKHPPSRDTSVDRYTRAASRLSESSRQPSVDRTRHTVDTTEATPSRVSTFSRGSAARSSVSHVTGNGVAVGAGSQPGSPFEEIILRQRSLGQDILPSPIGQPKRTESLYVASTPRKEPQKQAASTVAHLQRKKSLPDAPSLPKSARPMSREEVSVLSCARREYVRQMNEQAERLRANPFLYLVSPAVKDWFSRQQLLIVVLFVNISFAIFFYKLLTS